MFILFLISVMAISVKTNERKKGEVESNIIYYDCKNDTDCFLEHLFYCKPAKATINITDGITYITDNRIEGKRGDVCVRWIRVIEPEYIDGKRVYGYDMTCYLKKDERFELNPEKIVRYNCTGLLSTILRGQ